MLKYSKSCIRWSSIPGTLTRISVLIFAVYFIALGFRSAARTRTVSWVNHDLNWQSSVPPRFSWDDISPSKELHWTPCYTSFECTRFEVPLDYADASAGKAVIAVMRSPSSYTSDDARYQGPLLLNPGGPGGSGIEMLQIGIKPLRAVVGNGFDLVGFDPRGVGATRPRVPIFSTTSQAGSFLLDSVLTLNHSAEALGSSYARAQVLGRIAKGSDISTQNVAQYVGTPAVARDMLRIIEAFGTDKLHYYGMSYGTVLGATFAAMFPNNVGKVVLDGVVDSVDYYEGGWLDNLRDTDIGLRQLYQKCVDSGPAGCAIYESTPVRIETRVNALLESLKIHPIPFYADGYVSELGTSKDSYGIVDYSVAKRTIFSSLYAPYTIGSELLQSLRDLERGNAERLWRVSGVEARQNLVTSPCVCPVGPPSPPRDVTGGWAPGIAISCGDGKPVTDDLGTLQVKYTKLAQTSVFADVWDMHVLCSGWTLRGKERFNASFDTITNHPILFVGNTADPVTPLWNALKMSKLFTNSVLLIQNSAGHCSVMAPSICTVQALRAYFQRGEIPKEGTVCEIIDDHPSSIVALPKEVQEDARLATTLHTILARHHGRFPL